MSWLTYLFRVTYYQQCNRIFDARFDTQGKDIVNMFSTFGFADVVGRAPDLKSNNSNPRSGSTRFSFPESSWNERISLCYTSFRKLAHIKGSLVFWSKLVVTYDQVRLASRTDLRYLDISSLNLILAILKWNPNMYSSRWLQIESSLKS